MYSTALELLLPDWTPVPHEVTPCIDYVKGVITRNELPASVRVNPHYMRFLDRKLKPVVSSQRFTDLLNWLCEGLY